MSYWNAASDRDTCHDYPDDTCMTCGQVLEGGDCEDCAEEAQDELEQMVADERELNAAGHSIIESDISVIDPPDIKQLETWTNTENRKAAQYLVSRLMRDARGSTLASAYASSLLRDMLDVLPALKRDDSDPFEGLA